MIRLPACLPARLPARLPACMHCNAYVNVNPLRNSVRIPILP